MAILPFAEYRPDLNDMNKAYTSNVCNVLPRADGYGPLKTGSPYSLSMAAYCRGIFAATKTDGTTQWFAGDSTRLLTMDNSTLSWSDVSKGGVAYTALPLGDNWCFTQFGDVVIATQANSAPQAWTLGSSTAWANLGGSPPQARFCAVVNRFLVLSGLTSNPRRVQWSVLNAITTWTSGTSFSDYQDMPDGGNCTRVVGGEMGIIFQEGAVRRMIYTMEALDQGLIFTIDRITNDLGDLAPYAVTQADGAIYFVSKRGFYKMTLDGSLVPIGREKVDRTFLSEYDDGHPEWVQGAADPDAHLVYFTYKRRSDNVIYWTRILAYDYLLDRWSQLEVSGHYIAAVRQPGMTLEALDSISGSLDGLAGSLDDYGSATLPRIAYVNTDLKVSFFSGSPMEATLETAEQSGIGKRLFLRGYYPVTDAATVYGSTARRENLNATPAYSSENAITGLGYIPQRVSTRAARAKIRIPAGTTWTYAAGVEPDLAGEGTR